MTFTFFIWRIDVMNNSRERIKLLIELAETVEEADSVLEGEFPDSVAGKYGFLRGAYDFSVPFAEDGDVNDAEKNYLPVLSAIVKSRRRG
jgi:hypothetical protein